MIPIVLEKIVVILPSAVETEAPIDNLVVLAPVRSSLSMAESILRFLFEGIHVPTLLVIAQNNSYCIGSLFQLFIIS